MLCQISAYFYTNVYVNEQNTVILRDKCLRCMHRNWRKAGFGYFKNKDVVYLYFIYYHGLPYHYIYDTGLLDQHKEIHLLWEKESHQVFIIPLGLSASKLFKNRFPNYYSLNFASTLIYLRYFSITHHAFYMVLFYITISSKYLYGFGSNPHSSFGGK